MADEKEVKTTPLPQAPQKAGVPKARFVMHGKLKAPAPVPLTQQLDETDLLDKRIDEKQTLLDEIAAPDRAKQEKEQKKAKPEQQQQKKDKKNPVVEYIKSLSYEDIKNKVKAFFEKYKAFFGTLNFLWGVGMFCLYVTGITFFSLFLVVFFGFEPILRNQLNARDLQNISFTMGSRSLSEIVLTNIKDRKGLFVVDKVRLQYNLSDMLDGIISVATVNGLEIRLKEDEDGAIPLDNLLKTFVKLETLEKTSSVKINDMQILDSNLVLISKDGTKTTIPFYGTGNVKDQKKFAFPVAIKSQYLIANATLETQMTGRETTWNLTFNNGQLLLFEKQKADLTAAISWRTRAGKLQSIDVTATLTDTSDVKKEISLSAVPVQKEKDRTFNVGFTLVLSGGLFNKPMEINADLKNVVLAKNLRGFVTSSPLDLKITDFTSHLFDANVLHATLDGILECKELNCSYVVKKNSDLSLTNPSIRKDESRWSVYVPLRLTLVPSEKPILAWDGEKVIYNFVTRNFAFDSQKLPASELKSQIISSASAEKFSFDIKRAFLSGYYTLDDRGQKSKSDLELDLTEFRNNSYSIKEANFKGGKQASSWVGELKAKDIQLLENTLFKPHFELDLTLSKDNYFVAQIKTLNKQIDVSAQGYYNPYTGEIFASIKDNAPIVFDDENLQPIDISSLFGEEIVTKEKNADRRRKKKYKGITDVSGTVRFKGEIYYKNERSIDAPLHVLLDDVSFKYEDMEVKNMNSIMTLSHLVPFGTNGVQKATAKQIVAILPFNNISTSFLFDAQRKQFNFLTLDGDLNNYHLQIDPSWFTYDMPSYTFTMKGRMAPLDNWFEQTKFGNNITLKGEGSIDLSLKQEEGKLLLKNFDMSIPTAGSFAYDGEIKSDSLKILADAPFKKASLRLNQLATDTTDVIIMIEHQVLKQGRKRANIRTNITEPLKKFFIPSDPEVNVPEDFLKLKAAF